MGKQIFYNMKKMLKPLAPGIQWSVVKGTNMTVVYYEFKAGAIMPMAPHKHEHVQFTMPVEGLIEQTVGTETKVVGPGDLVYIAPGAVHSGRLVGYDCTMIDVFCPHRDDLYEKYLKGERSHMGDLPKGEKHVPAPASEIPAFIHMEDGNIQITKTCSIAPYDVSNMTAALLNVCEDQQEAEHHHPYEQINTYLAGRTVMSVEGQSEVCGPGWICVIPPDVPHEGTLVEPTLQVNFSSPARGAGYVEFLRNAFKTDQ